MSALLPTIVRVTVQPWRLSDGVQETVRLAGGGHRTPYRFGNLDYRAGIVTLPRLRAELNWEERGWTGGVTPQVGTLAWGASRFVDYVALVAGYAWKDAPVLVELAEERRDGSEPSTWSTFISGTVAGITARDGVVAFTFGDLSARLDKPVAVGRFTGAGGIEGPTEARERVKRRNFGQVFNVEARILDVANQVFEYGDPGRQATSVSAVRDMGRAASPAPTVVAWQGSVAATFAALQASSPAQGSGVVAPSIQCLKWWTRPVGPLTVDLVGEGGSANAPTLASTILGLAGVAIEAASLSAASSARPDVAGLHIDQGAETYAQALDRLLLGVSTLWVFNPSGQVLLRPLQTTGPVATLTASESSRVRVHAPAKRRRVGYKRNERTHGEGEIAASVLAEEVSGLPGLLAMVPLDTTASAKTPVVAGREVRMETTPSGNYGQLAYSREFWPLGSYVLGRWAGVGEAFLGLVTTANRLVGSLAGFSGWRFNGTTANPVVNGTTRSHTQSTVVASDVFQVTYDGLNFLYLRNGVQVWSEAAGADLVHHAKAVFQSSLSKIPDIAGGPHARAAELGADVTSYVTATDAKVDVQTTSAGVVKAGQLPRDTSFRLVRNGVTITSGITWSYRVLSGTLNGYTAASSWQTSGIAGAGTATLTISSVGGSGATVEVRAVYAGTTRTFSPFPVNVIADPPPSGGNSGGTGGTSSNLSSFTETTAASNSYGLSDNQLPNITTGSTGAISFTASLSYEITGGRGAVTAYGLFQYRTVGGTWTDAGAEEAGAEATRYLDPDLGEVYDSGGLPISRSVTGLSANTAYEVRLRLRDGSTTRGATFQGSAGAQGS